MKSYVFYDDTADYEAYDDVRAYLFDLHGEDNGWETADDVPDNWIYDEISEQNNADWRELLHDLGRVFKEDCYLLTGTCGRWCGPAQGGKFINSTDDLLACIKHLDKVKFYEQDGHFYIDGYHHDGSDHYELKRLTKKGYEFADRNYFAHDRQLHTTIMQNNFYSALPRLANRLYGV